MVRSALRCGTVNGTPYSFESASERSSTSTFPAPSRRTPIFSQSCLRTALTTLAQTLSGRYAPAQDSTCWPIPSKGCCVLTDLTARSFAPGTNASARAASPGMASSCFRSSSPVAGPSSRSAPSTIFRSCPGPSLSARIHATWSPANLRKMRAGPNDRVWISSALLAASAASSVAGKRRMAATVLARLWMATARTHDPTSPRLSVS
mmetsp:Transcript_10216/g.32489  ORF Transcript_10216/g.32489 Transcript_10216/m.32489 type:complete len:206 (+) Transcript_10216:1113-1730(+)